MTARAGTTGVLSRLLVSQKGPERLSHGETARARAHGRLGCDGLLRPRLWVCRLVGGLQAGRWDPLFPFSACSQEARGEDGPLCDPNAVFPLPLSE